MKNKVNGALWEVKKKKTLSPDLLGKVTFSRDLLNDLTRQLKAGKEAVLQIACWSAVSREGNRYYRVEATPLFQSTDESVEAAGQSEGLFGID